MFLLPKERDKRARKNANGIRVAPERSHQNGVIPDVLKSDANCREFARPEKKDAKP